MGSKKDDNSNNEDKNKNDEDNNKNDKDNNKNDNDNSNNDDNNSSNNNNPKPSNNKTFQMIVMVMAIIVTGIIAMVYNKEEHGVIKVKRNAKNVVEHSVQCLNFLIKEIHHLGIVIGLVVME